MPRGVKTDLEPVKRAALDLLDASERPLTPYEVARRVRGRPPVPVARRALEQLCRTGEAGVRLAPRLSGRRPSVRNVPYYFTDLTGGTETP